MSGFPKGPGDDDFDKEIDDWAAAIDEWDAALDLPDVPAVPPPPAAPPPEVRAAPAPAEPASAEAGEPEDLPPPLEALPIDPPPPGDDPLMQLFDGDMELPEEAGQALGSLLGAEGGEGALAGAPLDVEEAADAFGAETTRVAAADEVSALLDNLGELGDFAGFDEPAPPRVAEPAVESPELQVAEADVVEETRVASSEEFESLLGQPTVDELLGPPIDLDADEPTELRLDIEVPPAPPAYASDDDFYDDFSIEHGREEPPPEPEPAAAAPEPAPPPDNALLAESAFPDIDIDTDEPELLVSRDRASDPDRTPLPVGDDAPDDELFALPAASPVDAMPEIESRPLEVERLRLDLEGPLSLKVSELEEGPAITFDEEAWAERLSLLDTERLLSQDPERVALLACEAARLCERREDLAGAQERYEAALEADPASTAALRGLRRVGLRNGQSDRVAAMLDREVERASEAERIMLSALRAEIHLVRGDRDLAREVYTKAAAERPEDPAPLLGLVDVAVAERDSEALGGALGSLQARFAESGDGRWRAALAVERGRIDEGAGRYRDAVVAYRAAAEADAQSHGAAWGLLRVALRTPTEADDLVAHDRLARLLPRGRLRAGVERRLATLRSRAGDLGGARALLLGIAEGDALAQEDLGVLERKEGRAEEAAAAFAAAAELESDAGRRADLLIAAGELNEGRGATAEARALYGRAATEYPDDTRAAHALARTETATGDKALAVDRLLTQARLHPDRQALYLALAARLLSELGRTDDARDRLKQALAEEPGLLRAADLLAQLEVQAGRPAEGAEVLLRSADAEEEPALAAWQRGRAARLFARAGRLDEAQAALAPLVGGEEPQLARWLERRLVAGDPARLADALAREAEATELVDRARAAELWHERGLLAAFDANTALESHRRAVVLDGTHGPATVLAALRLAEAPLEERLEPWKARLGAAEGRAEAAAVLTRIGVALAEEPGRFAEARGALERASELAGDLPGPREALERLVRRQGDEAQRIVLLERELAESTEPERRFALLVAIAELNERANQPDRAAERYREALEARPGHPIAEASLERALRSGGNFSALADEALAALKEAKDARRKVAAYERLAYIDGELRGDPESALFAWQSIIEIDHSHHVAMRVLEQRYLREGRWSDLVALYDMLGLVGSDPAFATAVHLDRARLRRMVARAGADVSKLELDAAVDNDYRLALFKDPHLRPALRHVLARARGAGDLAQEAELSLRLSETPGVDERTAAVCLTRAGEALLALDRRADARRRLEAALERSSQHLPALLDLTDLGIGDGDFALAAAAAERRGESEADAAARAASFLLAGSIAEEKLDDPARALALYERALGADPKSGEAFQRQKRALLALGRHAELAAAIERRLLVETDGARLVDLHLELAVVHRDHLGDPARATAELNRVLAQNAGHPRALAMLADLYFDGERWLEAAETLIRRARIVRDRPSLKDVFFKLGVIYADKLPDAKRAIASFSRVLRVDPQDKVALEYLSSLYLKEWDWRGALEATRRLAQLEKDRPRRIEHLHRIAKIYEEGFKDTARALQALRAALELDPLHLGTVGELARFFDRQSDVQSMRVHLDRTAARFRLKLDKDPHDAEAYHALFRIFGWRRAPDRAALAAGVLDFLGAIDDEEKALLAKLTARDGYPGSALADPAIDETLFDPRVPAGFRHLFRLLDEPLAKLFRADIRRLGIGKNERLPPRGHALSDIAQRIAGDLGVRAFDLYVTQAHPTALMVELTDPPSLVLGAKLTDGAHEHEVRFYLGRLFKMVQSHMALPMRLSADDLGVLVGALVRQFVPDFVPAGFEERAVAAEAARMSKVIPKKLQSDLFPFAMECASAQLDLRQVAPALIDTANRAGLVTVGLIGPALSALRRLGDERQTRALLRYAMSEEVAELRRLLGTSLG